MGRLTSIFENKESGLPNTQHFEGSLGENYAVTAHRSTARI